MSMLAAIRPDSWNLPLLVHVFGAMVLVGGMTAAVFALLLGWRRDSATLTRLGFWSLLAVAFPAWWVMRLGGQWIYSRQGYGNIDPDWLGIGYTIADLGLPVLLITLIVTGIAARRVRTAEGPTTLGRIGGVLSAILLVAYLIAVWAMTVKPGS